MRDKKFKLIKNMALLLFVLLILITLSILNFQVLLNVDEKAQIKDKQYNRIYVLLSELETTVNKLDNFKSFYILTNKEVFLGDYNELIDVYLGNKVRNDIDYLIYYNQAKPFSELILNELSDFNPNFIDDMNVILAYVDSYIYFETTNETIIPEGDISLGRHNSNNFEEYDTGNAYYNLSLKIFSLIDTLKYELRENYYQYEKSIEYRSDLLKYSFYSISAVTTIYGVALILRMYLLFVKPIMEGHKLVEELSKGYTTKRWHYAYNNELKDLVNSFNNYVDLSQNSYNLIEEQYNKIQLYSNVGEINYFEYNVDTSEIKIIYCKKFVDQYNLSSSEVIYTVKEYLKLLHKDDVEKIANGMDTTRLKSNHEFKIEFRVKFPNSLDYCYLACTGERRKDANEVFMGVQFDISNLKLTQKRLQEQEEQYRIIVENSTDLIAKYDPKGNILYASKAFTDIFKHEKIIGANYQEFNQALKVSNNYWIEKVLKPPYSTKEVILVNTPKGEKWISWNNDAILNNDQEVENVISVGHDITELQKMNDKLKYDSEHDLLTGLLNRRGLLNTISQIDITTLAAFFIDINNFKNINDFYGHDIGDVIIKKVAEELNVFKEYNCIICRLSGDEFVLLVPNYASQFNINLLKSRLSKNLQKNYRIKNNNIYISSSVGYALYPEDTTDINKLISYADIAMYESKIAQHKKCLRFTKEMFESVNNKVQIANDLKKAIDQDEFDMVFQEIIDAKNNKISFIESLVRWNHPVKGLICPNEFIPVAKESGLMESLDLLIINKTLVTFCDVREIEQYNHTKLSINVSPIMLLKKDFPNQLYGLVKRLDLPVKDVCIEISEDTFVNNIEECIVQINKLRHLGFLVALDDFGREFSSLSILDRVDFDIIKIDRLFVLNLDKETNIEIVKMISKIANLKNKIVIVEGVETNSQVEKLMELGCHLMQGYYFSVPHKITSEVYS